MPLHQDAVRMLEQTSRTFFVPIIRLPAGLQEAVGSAYLCMRGLDEIEDSVNLSPDDKVHLLRAVAKAFEEADGALDTETLARLLAERSARLSAVTRHLGAYALQAPSAVAHRVWSATGIMAARMADWVNRAWRIRTRADLDAYTYDVAGAVGLLLTDLFHHFEGVRSTPERAVGFGRALQAVNILRNREEDRLRGVDFFPRGWKQADLVGYIEEQLNLAEAYLAELPAGPVHDFCAIPHALARATVDAIVRGEAKLTRAEVVSIMRSMGGDVP